MPEEQKMKIGLEIHFQLDTGKLFCSCSTNSDGTELLRFSRKLVPTVSELGRIDPAAEYEKGRERTFEYIATDNSCLVECDEEPPHEANPLALETALVVSRALNCKILDKISFMRKVVVDGSNTSGFQRTALVGLEGNIKTSKGPVRISSVSIEEDSARKIDTEEARGKVVYSLDRLGTPLIEIATEPDIIDGDHAVEVAKKIGYYVMATGNARREVDSIRQDVNMSMGFGRIEIKGVQKLSLIKETLNYEMQRQRTLKEISLIIGQRGGFDKRRFDFVDVTDVFKETKSSMFKKGISAGDSVYACLAENLEGTLKKNSFRLGKELSDVAKAYGLGGIVHSDELPAFGISQEELSRVYGKFNGNENKALIMILCRKAKIERIGKALAERVLKIISMDLSETRGPMDDGTTKYLRPLPGSERMYPETDLPISIVSERMKEQIEEKIPLSEEESQGRLVREYGISKQEASIIVSNFMVADFERFNKILNEPKAISRLLLQTVPEFERKYQFKFGRDQLLSLFEEASHMKWTRQIIEKAAEIMAKEKLKVSELAGREELIPLTDDEIMSILKDLKAKYGENLTNKNVIAKLKGEIDRIIDASKVMELFETMN